MVHLVKNTYNIYRVRLRVSSELQPYFCKKEINKSLEYKEAIFLSQNIINEYKKINLGATLGLYTEEQTESLVNKFLSDT